MSDCVLEMEEEAGNMPCHRVASEEEEEEKDFDIPRVKAGKDAFKGPKRGKQQRDVSNHNWGRCSTTRVSVDICLKNVHCEEYLSFIFVSFGYITSYLSTF